MVHYALDQGLEVLGDVSVNENSRSNKFERLNNEQDRLKEDVNAYRTEMEQFVKTLPEKEVPMKAMTCSVVDL